MLACGMEVEIDAASFGFKMKCRMVSIAFSGVLRSPAAKEKAPFFASMSKHVGQGSLQTHSVGGMVHSKVKMQFFPVITQVYAKVDFTPQKSHVYRNSQHIVTSAPTRTGIIRRSRLKFFMSGNLGQTSFNGI